MLEDPVSTSAVATIAGASSDAGSQFIDRARRVLGLVAMACAAGRSRGAEPDWSRSRERLVWWLMYALAAVASLARVLLHG